MKKIVIALSVLSACAIAQADEDINYSLNLKGWNHQLDSGSTKLESTTATLASLTAKKGDYFVVAAFILPATYARDNQALIIRRDADLALGWSATSNVSLVIGQKRLGARNYRTDNLYWENEVINFSYLGANGFKMTGENTYLYGQVNSSFKGKSNLYTNTVKLTTYEAGLGYLVNKNTQLTGGYRSQKFSSDGSVKLNGPTFGVNLSF